MTRNILILFISLFVIALSAVAQNAPVDSTLTDSPLGNAVSLFAKRIGEQAEIYNGKEYFFAPKAYKGNPYYRDTLLFTSGTVKYNGTWYKNISMLYDSYLEVIATTRPTNPAVFIMRDTLVSEFYLYNQHFVHIVPAGGIKSILKPGFYEDLYNAKTIVLAKQYKTRSERPVLPVLEVTYTPETDHYIIKDNIAYRVSSKNSVLKVFKDKKNELNNYLKTNNITFKDDKTLAIVKMAAYYDQLSH